MVMWGSLSRRAARANPTARQPPHLQKKPTQGDAADVLWMSVSLSVLLVLSAQMYRLYAYAVYYAGATA